MKKNMLVLAVVVSVVLISGLCLNAMTSTVLRVNVPFAFHIGKTTLPAGNYILEMDRATSASALGTAVTLRTIDGKTQLRTASMPGYGAKSGASLTFNRYANSYFLATVESYGLGCQLRKSKAEKEVAAKAAPFQRASVAAE
ncbi:MAG: hypothetical protein EHM61_07710 [Acidobacteria bacterium]|nr:MAG: hypothetical protein EHM61_07710 [Acidobacteriota bacterium]